MAFNSFSIRLQSDDSYADLDTIDKAVCDKFGLDFNEEDYGLFHLTYEADEHQMHQVDILGWADSLCSVL